MSKYEGKNIGEIKNILKEEFLDPISELTPEAQNQLSELFNLDRSDMSLQEYEDKINNGFKEMFPNDEDTELRDSLKSKFGFDNAIEMCIRDRYIESGNHP